MTTDSTNTGAQSGEPDSHPTADPNANGQQSRPAAASEAQGSGAENSAANRGNLRPSDAPVLDPRPVYRPDIDKHTARAFRRPDGHEGSFAPYQPTAPQPAQDSEVAPRPPDAVLAEAFGRPAYATESLQRDPYAADDDDAALAPADPWRDPEAAVRLGAPAVTVPQPQPRPAGSKLSVREVLFGGRVKPTALLALAVVALLIGLLGGLIGRIGGGGSSLTSHQIALQQDNSPAGPLTQVGKVAQAVKPAVVQIRETVGENAALGSGVIVDGAGYIVTNNHVISMAALDKTGQAKIQVTFNDGSKTAARLVGRDQKSDLAVLKVDNVKNLQVMRLGKSGDVRVGDEVIAIGTPLGLSETVTSGIVSALDRPLAESPEPGDDSAGAFYAVQTDAAINHGNSGGALVDTQGRLIGINTAIKSDSGGSVGLGFAIPVDLVQRVAQTLIHGGTIDHPWLGVSAKTKTVENDVMSGAEVADVTAGSPAAKAGLAEGDVIIQVGDREVTTPEELTVAIQTRQVGDQVTLQVVRDGRKIQIPVTLESDKNAPKPPQ